MRVQAVRETRAYSLEAEGALEAEGSAQGLARKGTTTDEALAPALALWPLLSLLLWLALSLSLHSLLFGGSARGGGKRAGSSGEGQHD